MASHAVAPDGGAACYYYERTRVISRSGAGDLQDGGIRDGDGINSTKPQKILVEGKIPADH